MNTATTRTAALAAADAVVLLVLRPRWTALADGLAHPRSWLAGAPDAALATASGALLWVVAVWIAIGLTAGAGARLPGTVGRLSGRCARVVVPQVLLRVIIGSTGLGLLAAPAAHAAAPAEARPPAAVSTQASASAAQSWLPGATPPTDTPLPSAGAVSFADTVLADTVLAGTSLAGTVPAPTWPVGANAGRSPALPPPTPPTSDSSTQRVRPGDSLWLLAARRLGTHAGDHDVAHYWPQIYAANRSVIGDDPSVIHPGQVLNLPAPTQESR
jgi:nucleoid-associated protein YgaU